MSAPASPTFKIIGTDGKEYGPVDLATLLHWARQRRVAAQTRVWDSRTGNWQHAALIPELVNVFETQRLAAPLAPAAQEGSPRDVKSMATIPAVFMLVVASICLAWAAFGLVFGILVNCFQVGVSLASEAPEAAFSFLFGMLGILLNAVSILINVLIIVGSVKMWSLKSFAWSMTAAILSLLPLNCCCFLPGLATGIWSLVVLNNPAVKAAFKR